MAVAEGGIVTMVNREPADIIVQFATVFLYIIEIKRVKDGGGGGSRLTPILASLGETYR